MATSRGKTEPDAQRLRATEAAARRRAMQWAAALTVATFPADMSAANPHLWLGGGLRLLMAATFLGSAAWVTRAAEVLQRRLLMATGLATSTLYCLLVVLSGGAAGPNYAWMTVVPLASVLIFGWDFFTYIGPFSVLNAGLGAWLVHQAGGAAAASLSSALERLASGALAMIAALLIRRLTQNQARLTAELQLARLHSVQSERLALVGQLAAGVAHEINNPLSYVKGNLELLSEELTGNVDPDLLSALKDTAVGVDRIERIVTDLRGFARASEGRDDVCVVSEALDEALRLSAHRLKYLTLSRDVPSLPVADAPAHRVVQILVNLLVNAADALFESRGAEGRIDISARHARGRIELRVEDNGPGLTPEQLERLFTPFFTTKDPGKGTGLGLALSKAYLDQMDGSITAENRPQGGACFRVTLRARRSAPTPPPRPPSGAGRQARA